MSEKSPDSESRVNALVGELLSAGGGGRVFALGGFLGPAADGRVRVYADLRLGTFVELAESDVVRVVDAERETEPSTVFFRRDAEITFVQTATMRVQDAIAAAAAAPVVGSGGCGCGGGSGSTVGRQVGGGAGPVVDICSWACIERLRTCEVGKGTIGKLWCYLEYGACRFGCLDPPIIAV
jgi:hypothetical protein